MEVNRSTETHDTSETMIVEDIVDVVNEDYMEQERMDELILQQCENIADPNRIPEKEKIVQLPLTRIKNLIKLDPDVNLASQDAVFVIAKAAELFITMLGREAYKFTKQNKKKTIQKKDIDDCIGVCDSLAFLEGTLKDDL